MSEMRKQFETVLAEFGQIAGCALALGERSNCWIIFNGATETELVYEDATDEIRARVEVCRLDDDAVEAGTARRLLSAAGDPSVTRGCTLALEKATRMLVVRDWRPASWLYTADRLASWFQRLLRCADEIRETVAGKVDVPDFHLYEIRV